MAAISKAFLSRRYQITPLDTEEPQLSSQNSGEKKNLVEGIDIKESNNNNDDDIRIRRRE